MDNIITIMLLTIGASFVQRTTGFGFGIFIMTMLPFLMPSYGEATTLSGLLALTTSLFAAWKYRKLVRWKRLLPILGVFFMISTVSIIMLTRINEHNLKIILGIILIIVSLYFSFFSKRIKFGTSLPYQIGAGTASGLMGGFFGMHGPPAVLYFISAEKDKEHYMGMIQTYFVITNAMMTITRACNGFLTKTVAGNYLFCLAAVGIGTFLGSLAFKRISSKSFPYVVYAYIGISGIIILTTALTR